MRSDFRHWKTVDVRWNDMDMVGHVNNATYFTYFEVARVNYFDGFEESEQRYFDGQGPVVVSATCNYKIQVRHPAKLDVGARIAEMRNRSLTMLFEIYEAGGDTLVADGQSIHAWIDFKAQKSIQIPDSFRERIRAFEVTAPGAK